MKLTKLTAALCFLCAFGLNAAWAQSSDDEVAQLKARLADQQKQIELLRQTLEDQQKMLNRLAAAPASPRVGGLVASTTGTLPAPTASASTSPVFTPPAPASEAPLQLQIGDVTIMPVGFMDLTMVARDKDAGSSIASSFGSIPYNTAVASQLSEFRFSPQNSRIGFRIDGDYKGYRFIAYNEFDFNGTSGGTNLGVTNGSFVPRLRLFWADVQKGEFEFLAGQSWSLMVPNRKGLSALPGDLFYSQVVDLNYLAGLTWDRQPGVRFILHPSKTVALGIALENPDQYMGGSSGGSSIVLPAALTGLAGTQIDNASNTLVTPNLAPDIIAKVAFDPTSRVHFEVAGIERTFKLWNTVTHNDFTKAGGGGSINGNFEIVKGLRLISNNYWSDGGGRYLFGQAPDFVVRSDGSISPIHAGGVNEGFEATVGKTVFYAYYGGIYIGRNVAVDANGTSLVGYGYHGSANGQNRSIQEGTFGFNQTLWKDGRYGAMNIMGQYEYLTRNPWYLAAGAPKAAHDNTVYINFRYTLPGAPPAIK